MTRPFKPHQIVTLRPFVDLFGVDRPEVTNLSVDPGLVGGRNHVCCRSRAGRPRERVRSTRRHVLRRRIIVWRIVMPAEAIVRLVSDVTPDMAERFRTEARSQGLSNREAIRSAIELWLRTAKATK